MVLKSHSFIKAYLYRVIALNSGIKVHSIIMRFWIPTCKAHLFLAGVT
jgi:hypothetical protein